MKNKLLVIFCLGALLITLTGCSSTKTLTCKTTEEKDGRTSNSTLEVKIKDEEVKDMNLTVEMTLSPEQQYFKQSIINQMLQKTNKVYSTENGIRAIFGMGSEYFDAFGLSKDVSYSEVKQVLEIQGYTCE